VTCGGAAAAFIFPEDESETIALASFRIVDSWNDLAAFACMVAAACFIFLPKS
jgi:hypothetical protein